jgi:hypothetical protein
MSRSYTSSPPYASIGVLGCFTCFLLKAAITCQLPGIQTYIQFNTEITNNIRYGNGLSNIHEKLGADHLFYCISIASAEI